MLFKIMKQDTVAAILNDKNGVCESIHEMSMPVDLYLEQGEDFDTCMNNLQNFFSWCSDRLLSLDRMYAKAILNACGLTQSNNIRSRAYAALQYHALTLTDFYWVQKIDEDLQWDSINLFENSLSNSIVIALTGATLTVQNAMLLAPDCSTAGVAPKAWIRDDKSFYLLKGDVDGSVRKEIEASQILITLGIPCVSYGRFEFQSRITSRCAIFTDKHTALVTAEQYSFNNNLQELLKLKEFQTAYCLMNLGDYLIGNTDRHWGNWGFLQSDTNQFRPAPLMDFNHAFEAIDETPCLPEKLLGNHCSQLEGALRAFETLCSHPTERIEQLKENMMNFNQAEFCYGRYVEQRIQKLLKQEDLLSE